MYKNTPYCFGVKLKKQETLARNFSLKRQAQFAFPALINFQVKNMPGVCLKVITSG